MKRILIIALAALLLPVLAGASDYKYISQDDMRTHLDNHDAVTIVDICPMEQFAKGHLPGSIETNAYPVKTDEERAKLDAIMPKLTTSTDDIVIICPGGAGGAKRTYDFYKAKGVDESRLFILEKGMNGWPYQTVAK
ncbi:rhodanese-like domain-containing protein [Pseudodesulfovibrio sediminis]|uniref:Rhodanese domain-containing protein n=1 Tax=Pseudodesulfovibrio sediminis TaxID=2810563 RepID=A0ABN6ENR4_9BACT|nr:rhodanese-like domain-containing protein [Pseudodesulfovibrio sediminis]BCS86929.1 hypothetical protein PSDVSF_01710 [Pseudodesulfovibrio sediminis]